MMRMISGIGLAMLAAGSLQAGVLVLFSTSVGQLDVELFDEDKPETVRNFLRYVNSGAYRDMFIHRWEPGFVIQGGGYRVTDRHTTNAAPARIETFPDILNEYSVGRTYSNAYGTLAMARRPGETNSANSQWYFNLTNNFGLDNVDGGFTVFGRVLSGTNNLNRFNNTSPTNGLYSTWVFVPDGILTTVPLTSTNATVDDLIYVDIRPLKLEVQTHSSGGQEISWNSVSNRVHHLEYTTVLPPDWRPLISTNGTGGLMSFVDTVRRTQVRLYRLRVDY